MKATCDTFVDALRIINKEGIINLDTLRENPNLYSEFWFALKEFCHFALCSKTSSKKPNKKKTTVSSSTYNNGNDNSGLGNTYKISELERRAFVMRDEVETDCAIKILENLNLVLRQPIGVQKNYCYVICNNTVNTYWRNYFPKGITVVHMPDSPDARDASSDNTLTYESIIPDNRYNPEFICIENESEAELEEYLRAQKENERKAVIHEISSLSKRPAEVLARLAWRLKIKPRQLASDILNKGCSNVFAEVIVKTANEYSIKIDDVRRVIANQAPTEKSGRADSNDAEIIAGQISRLTYRANKHLAE